MQTAVEWLHDNLTKIWYDVKSSKELLERAKQIEKQQIIDAYSLGYGIGYDDAKFNTVKSNEAEQHYNETFTSTQQNENPSAT
jgi:hypothetical protein